LKVLLVQPPIEDFYDTGIRTYPLGLLYLAAKINNICEVSVLDLRTVEKPVKPEYGSPAELNDYYREDIYTPLSLFSGYHRFGYSLEKTKDIISSHKPDVVCISSLFTTYAIEALDIARICKKIDSSIITVMGGTHATIFPEYLLKSPYVDYVIRGEGETPLLELIKSIKTNRNRITVNTKGICFKDGDNLAMSDIHIENDIDLIPDRGLVDATRYKIGRNNYTFFLSTRGCPFHCSFCGKPPVPYRKRTIVSMEQEISECIDLNIRAIDFEDDMLTLDVHFFNDVLNLFKDKGLTLSAMNGIYSETLDRKTISHMYEAGFRRLNFSLVDINQHITKRGHRFYSKKFLNLLPFIESSPFFVEAHFIIGLPDQKPEHVIDTLIFLMEKRILPGPSIFYLAPNTPLFENFFDDDWEKHIKSLRSSFMFPANPLFHRNVTFSLMKLVRFVNLVKHKLDKNSDIKRLSDILYMNSGKMGLVDKEILTELIRNKRLICYDKKQKIFFEEKQDKPLINTFFKAIRNRYIKGFKTANSLFCDV